MRFSMTLLTVLAVSLMLANSVSAQPGGGGGRGGAGRGPGARGGAGGPGGFLHMLPLMQALDADSDGVISAQEIENAAAALKTLDKNGDGQLTEDELRPNFGGAGGGRGGVRGGGGQAAEGRHGGGARGQSGDGAAGGGGGGRPQRPAAGE